MDKTVLFELPFNLNHAPLGHSALATPEGAVALPTTTPITVKSLVLLLGGLFLVGKATWEIGHQLDSHQEHAGERVPSSFAAVLVQIFLIDMVFSLDSVLTAVGMVRPEDYAEHWVPMTIMVTAVLVSIAVMLAFSGPVSRFVNQHPSVKMLALAFLILIGVVLFAEGLSTHIPRGYIYASMAFSLFVEMLNLRASRGGKQLAAGTTH